LLGLAANPRYAVASRTVWVVAGVSLAIELAAGNHGGVMGWIVVAVIAVLSA
jgi:hypothetical protein